jgi:hypothetical protein
MIRTIDDEYGREVVVVVVGRPRIGWTGLAHRLLGSRPLGDGASSYRKVEFFLAQT